MPACPIKIQKKIRKFTRRHRHRYKDTQIDRYQAPSTDPGTRYNWKDSCLLFQDSNMPYKEGEGVPKFACRYVQKSWVIECEWEKYGLQLFQTSSSLSPQHSVTSIIGSPVDGTERHTCSFPNAPECIYVHTQIQS